ncbi:MAG: thiamine diphosphokinase [Candidatus Marinimicrobia bacterium]|nr:thiamine diphosphokinase [Candidatus Neomarinimicrobiota bacterium]
MTDKKISVIIANGDFTASERITGVLKSADRIICADGGANHLVSTGFTPDLIIGDMDSLLPVTQKKYNDIEFLKDTSEQTTDLMKAVDHEISIGIDRIIFLGVTGNRSDHTMASFSLLKIYAPIVEISILNTFAEVDYIRKSFTFESPIGRKISLMVMSGISSITSQGLKWELNGESYDFSPFGVSNEVMSSPVILDIEGDGAFLFRLFEMNDGSPLLE